MKQLNLIEFQSPIGKVFVIKEGQRKTRRPLSTRHPIHIILKSASRHLRRNERQISREWLRLAKKFGVKTYQFALASDHIHAAVRLHSRELYRQFIQALTGTLARKLKIKWLMRPVTRIGAWGRDFKRLIQYIKLNWLEAEGFLQYQPRRTRGLPDWVKL